MDTVQKIRHNGANMDVYYGNCLKKRLYVIRNINPNVVRCAIGEDTMNYMLSRVVCNDNNNGSGWDGSTPFRLADFK